MNKSEQIPFVAIYWDFENVHVSLHEQEIGPFWAEESRETRGDAILDVSAVMAYASSLGSVCINRAYADWTYYRTYSDPLLSHGVELIQLFKRNQKGKNGADIQMCVDLVEDLHRRPYVDIYLLVSGDSDFIGVAQKIRQHGKKVIGVGVGANSSKYFVRVCDEFKTIENLSTLQPRISGDMENPFPSLDQAKNVLVAAMETLIAQHGSPRVLKARVKPVMLRLAPAFDERSLGYHNFSSFLNDCQDVVTEETAEGDNVLILKGSFTGVRDAAVQESGRLLEAALTVLTQARNSTTVPMAMVKPMMQRMRAEFDEKKLGFITFTSFLRRFTEMVRITGDPNKQVEFLGEAELHEFTAPALRPTPAPAMNLGSNMLEPFIQYLWSLKEVPAPTWEAYNSRIRQILAPTAGDDLESRARSIHRTLWTAQCFRTLPQMGGISISDEFVSYEKLQERVLVLLNAPKDAPDGDGPGLM